MKNKLIDKSCWIILFVTTLLLIVLFNQPNTHRQTGRVPLAPLSAELPNFSEILPVANKKQAFFDYLRPFIRQQNMKLRYERAFLLSIKKDFTESPHHNRATFKKIKRLAKVYSVSEGNMSEMLSELTLKVDEIPESLVLAQAANESAWGSSRFAKQANNLFGEWCFTKGCGLVPKKRSTSQKHEIRRFDTPKDSIVSYMKNLNSHKAYSQLREIRQALRANNKVPKGEQLAQGLESYSERGWAYINDIVRIIEQNNLE